MDSPSQEGGCIQSPFTPDPSLTAEGRKTQLDTDSFGIKQTRHTLDSPFHSPRVCLIRTRNKKAKSWTATNPDIRSAIYTPFTLPNRHPVVCDKGRVTETQSGCALYGVRANHEDTFSTPGCFSPHLDPLLLADTQAEGILTNSPPIIKDRIVL